MCASLLLRTAVPSGLRLPRVDAEAVFGKALVRQTVHVERFFLFTWVIGQIALFTTLWIYARRGPRFARESAAGPIGTGMLLGMLGIALAWLAGLPFSVLALWWDRRHGLSRVAYVDVVLGGWLALAGAFLALTLGLVVVMCLARWLGSWWWLPAALALGSIAAVLVFAEPYLATGLEPPSDQRLEQSYERLARAEGVDGVTLRVQKVSGDTSQANAYAFGLGPSRRIVVWDTLLDGRFADGEVDVVLAHELGHQASHHIAKAIGWFVLFALPAALVVMLVTRRRGGMGDPASVPLALLVVALLALAAMPAQNVVSRRMESEADWKALETTRDPTAARGLFRELAVTSLGDPSPPTWAYVAFATHPTLAQRVAMADAWAQREGR